MLPEVDQSVIDLFFNKDMSQKDIAEQLNLSRSKVNRIIGKTITKLREKINR